MTKTWYKSKVLRGQKLGRTLGFPTVNLDPAIWPKDLPEGVYACLIKYDNKIYRGALYYGPRLVLNETDKVLEIYILDFKKDIYDKIFAWQIKKHLRKAQNFSSLEGLKIQLKKDIEDIRRLE